MRALVTFSSFARNDFNAAKEPVTIEPGLGANEFAQRVAEDLRYELSQ
jgi:hypothetical protein